MHGAGGGVGWDAPEAVLAVDEDRRRAGEARRYRVSRIDSDDGEGEVLT